MLQASSLFRLLGDEARLRILRLLAAERLNVSELTGILGIAQSGVSRHLGLLKDAGLIVEQREGGYTYFRPIPTLLTGENGLGPLSALLQGEFAEAARTETGRADDARLAEVRRLRKENFDAHAGPDTNERQLVPGRSWAAWSRALGHLLPPLRVADIGCGEGYLTVEASRWASHVVAVDRSDLVLKRARALATRRRVRNVIWKRGELEKLPLRDASVDVALLSQALHHAPDPARALPRAGMSWCSTCASTMKSGSRIGSAIGGWASATTRSRSCSSGPGFLTSGSMSVLAGLAIRSRSSSRVAGSLT
jgi:DNA-binding transcriptional ArsR family regulator